MNQKVRLIALDMDGTLLLSDHATIPDRNIASIRKAQAMGIRVLICTGRLPEDISDYLKRMNLSCMIIACNGATAYTAPMPQGKRMFLHTLPAEDAKRAIAFLAEKHMVINGFESGVVNTFSEDPESHYHLVARHLIEEKRGLENLMAAAERGILKLYCYADYSRDRMREIRDELAGIIPNLVITASGANVIEVNAAGTDKGNALRHVAEMLTIPREAVMAIGDEENDIPMLQYAGFSVAMGNAIESVKKICRFVTAENDACGVSEAIESVL